MELQCQDEHKHLSLSASCFSLEKLYVFWRLSCFVCLFGDDGLSLVGLSGSGVWRHRQSLPQLRGTQVGQSVTGVITEFIEIHILSPSSFFLLTWLALIISSISNSNPLSGFHFVICKKHPVLDHGHMTDFAKNLSAENNFNLKCSKASGQRSPFFFRALFLAIKDLLKLWGPWGGKISTDFLCNLSKSFSELKTDHKY